MIKPKIDILGELKKAGYSTYRIRKARIFSEGTLQEFREGGAPATTEGVNRLCKLLNCQPGDLLEYVDDDIE